MASDIYATTVVATYPVDGGDEIEESTLESRGPRICRNEDFWGGAEAYGIRHVDTFVVRDIHPGSHLGTAREYCSGGTLGPVTFLQGVYGIALEFVPWNPRLPMKLIGTRWLSSPQKDSGDRRRLHEVMMDLESNIGMGNFDQAAVLMPYSTENDSYAKPGSSIALGSLAAIADGVVAAVPWSFNWLFPVSPIFLTASHPRSVRLQLA